MELLGSQNFTTQTRKQPHPRSTLQNKQRFHIHLQRGKTLRRQLSLSPVKKPSLIIQSRKIQQIHTPIFRSLPRNFLILAENTNNLEPSPQSPKLIHELRTISRTQIHPRHQANSYFSTNALQRNFFIIFSSGRKRHPN